MRRRCWVLLSWVVPQVISTLTCALHGQWQVHTPHHQLGPDALGFLGVQLRSDALGCCMGSSRCTHLVLPSRAVVWGGVSALVPLLLGVVVDRGGRGCDAEILCGAMGGVSALGCAGLRPGVLCVCCSRPG